MLRPGVRPRSRARARALPALGALAALVGGGLGLAVPVSAAHAAAAATGFTAGDVVVYRVGAGSTALGSAGAPVFLDDYTANGTLRSSVALPTTPSGSNKALVASGSATSEGGLTLSADGRYLVATGYNAAVGTGALTSSASASVTRTVALVDGTGAVDTTTSLSDFSDGNNPRSAATVDGSSFWVAGAASSVRYAVHGATTSTAITSSTLKNNRQVEIAGGQLYTSADSTKAGTVIATVGSGLPTSGTQTVTNLPFSGGTPTQPYQYSFLTLGSGTAPDTLYVADNSAGAVLKYVLTGGAWVQRGSTSVTGVTGVTANDNAGTVTIFATSTNSGGTSGTLSTITDTGGLSGTLSTTSTPASVIASAPANEAFRGVAFAPGTVIGSGGGGTTSTPPTISVAHAGLPAALHDTNPTDTVTLGDATYTADQLTLTATSTNTAVVPSSGISLTGTGATRVLAVTPAATGRATITLTVSAPDGTSASTSVLYGASADLGNAADRYLTGAGNASAAVDLGNGYLIAADDENDVLRLYDTATSGPPVKTFDFTSVFPFGTGEIDFEGAARSGNTLYFEGSMSNNSSGVKQPSRSTLVAVTVSGTGAGTTLTYVGSYTGLQTDLVNWDNANGHGLGAGYLGFDNSVNGGVDGHETNALNVEGLEFAGTSSSTAYLAFRGPLEPTSNRHLALVVPVTDINQLVTGAATKATFGAPLFWDLGGYGIRDIKENADGQYLVIAGTADGANTSFVLYQWDGNPAHQPVPTGTTLPSVPSSSNQGSWETVVSVPDPLTAGSSLNLIQDDGTVDWYGDGLTTKTGLPPDLAKSIERTFTYTPPAPSATTTTLTSSNTSAAIGETVTYTSTSTSGVARGALTGTVSFADGGTPISSCSAQPLGADGTATCTVTYQHAGTHDVTATYSGDGSYATSTSAHLSQGVGTTTVTVTADDQSVVYGAADPTLSFTATGFAPGDGFTTPPTCTVAAAHHDVGTYPITCSGGTTSSDYTLTYVAGTLHVTPAPLTVTADDQSAVYGAPEPSYTATTTGFVGSDGLATGPTCGVSAPHTHVGAYPITCSGADAGVDYSITYAPGTLTITQAPLTITANDASVAHGDPDPGFGYGVTGLVGGDSVTTPPTCGVDVDHTHVGSYPITCHGAAASTDYTLRYATGTLTVTASSVVVTADPQTEVYGSADPAFTFTATGFASGDGFTTPPTCTVATSHHDVGTYPVTCSGGTASSDYTVSYATGDLRVTPAPLTITAADQTTSYGGPEPTYTATTTGLVGSDGLATGPTCGVPASHVHVGTYAIRCSGADAGPDYTISYATGTLSVTPAPLTITPDDLSVVYASPEPAYSYTAVGLVGGDALTTTPTCGVDAVHGHVGSYAITCSGATASSDYVMRYATGTLTVTPATVTVTPTDQTRVYGTPDPNFTWTTSGLVGTDTLTRSPTCGVTGAHDTVGSYSVTCTGATASADYTVRYTPGTLSVTRAPLVVTPDDQTRTYGTPDPALSSRTTGLVGDDALTEAPACSVTPDHVHVGSYPITCSGADAGPDYAITYATGTLRVTRATLTVIAQDRSKVYGADDPAYTWTTSGLVGGDALVTAPTCGVAGDHAHAGSYDVACSGAVATSDYTLRYVDGTLSVTPAPLLVSATDRSEVYGATEPTYTSTVTGLLGSDTLQAAPTCGVIGAHTHVGAYPITCSGAVASSDYTVTYAPGTLQVTPATVVVTADDVSTTAGRPDPPFTYRVTGLLAGDSLTAPATCTVSATHDVAGRYPVTCAGASAGADYRVTYVDGTLLVTPAPAPPRSRTVVHATHAPRTVHRARTRARLLVRVTAANAHEPAGRVTVRVPGHGTLSAMLRHGRATLRLPRFPRTGRQVLTVSYLGDGADQASRTTVVLTVTR